MAAYVYILTNRVNTTLYVGVTNNLERRLAEHRSHFTEGFTDKYKIDKLVWFSECTDISSAIEQEKKIKNRNRQWKCALIEKDNPGWLDLSGHWTDMPSIRDTATPAVPASAQHDA